MTLELAATVDKTCSLVEEAARHGARLVAFPETYIPAFPVWNSLQAPIYSHDLFGRLAANSMYCPGDGTSAECGKAGRRLRLPGLQ